MRRLLVVVMAALMAAVVFTATPAGAHTERQLHNALSAINAKNAQQTRQINNLTAKLNCLGKMPVTSFADYAFYNPITITEDGGTTTGVIGDPGVPNVGLWWTYGTGAPADAFVVAVRPTAACRAKFATLADPNALALSAAERSGVYATKQALR